MLGISQAQRSRWFCSPAVVDSICHPRHISPSSPIRDESCTSLGISQAVRQRTLTPPRGGSNPSSPTKLKSFGLRTAHFVRVDSEWDSLTLPPHPQPIPHLSPSWRFFYVQLTSSMGQLYWYELSYFMELPSTLGNPGIQEHPKQTEPDSPADEPVNVKKEFEQIRTDILWAEWIHNLSLHEVMEMVAKRVVPLLVKTYPHSGETLERYVDLRDEIQEQFRKEMKTVPSTPKKPLSVTQRVKLLFHRPGITSQHSPPFRGLSEHSIPQHIQEGVLLQ